MTYFTFSEYWMFYLGFTGFVLFLLALDLGVFHRKEHAVGFREAGAWTCIWITLALCFNWAFYHYCLAKLPAHPQVIQSGVDAVAESKRLGLEFLTGFVVEKSLAIDNLFVFVALFTFFAIPPKYQHRVLFYGIIGALIFRAIFIALGSVLLQYTAIVMFFGVLLIITGVKLFFAPTEEIDPSKNVILRLLKRFIPVTHELHGKKFLVKVDGKWLATPLLLALVFVEVSDIIFAVDSVPAIFALTSEPFIVFTSNVFAILGLRSMYFLLAGVYERFWLLKYGLGFVLIFVGLKMVWLNDLFGGKFPITWSLGIIGSILLLATILSFATSRGGKSNSIAVG